LFIRESALNSVKPVKLIIGFIFQEESNYKKAKNLLIKRFGKIDFESAVMPFNLTDYYAKEFGTGLKKIFVSFEKLIHPKRLAQIKILTNQIESRLSSKGKRLVNIDPGYLDQAKLILASTKDFAHRIYLDNSIFAEITLSFKGNSFKAWDWTYPDFRTDDYIAVFNKIREIYRCQNIQPT
jgi:hypothetical protein